MPTPDPLFAAATRRTGFPALFNPFRQRDLACDAPHAARRRRNNLARYFAALDVLGSPRDLWLAGAPGAAGTRRTGIPLVDERELALANHHYAIDPPLARVTDGPPPAGTSTGQAIWREIARTGYRPVLWNVLLHHPERRVGGRLTNRPPRAGEVQYFTPLIEVAYRRWCLGPERANETRVPRVIAIGKFAERAALSLKLPNVTYVRHPAQGGLREFRDGMAVLYDG